jgi:hypothetical protein
MKNHIVLIIAICVALIVGAGLHTFLGAGAFDRHFTLSGIYAVCKPKGYDAVCFLDSDSKDGGLSCLPLSAVGGKCR